ncbi:ferrous iron transport protein B [Methanococcoides orientis]|uniref:ferrous iron transport protein B n=1 Tax=Methanococcoides orientis TaxID=2822137 RepID=UPI001E49B524|nr:ferrous iron transport protein B [Methanococcoides orientis]UGV40236.1 ferrous iron transport protein B [Methanococcoides orientis]
MFTKLKKKRCCDLEDNAESGLEKIILVGNPNVGKSVIFNHFSDSYAIVSNYPGTTVAISKGKGKIAGKQYEIIDTPGMYSLLPITEEERVSQSYLFDSKPFVYLHVVDAKNLQRMLPLTLQLIEAEVPLILVLNMMDEAAEKSIEINEAKLENELGIPVICTTSIKGEGLDRLENAIADYDIQNVYNKVKYSRGIESAIEEISSLIRSEFGVSKRTLAQLLLQNDRVAFEKIVQNNEDVSSIKKVIEETEKSYTDPLNYVLTIERQTFVNDIVDPVMSTTKKTDTLTENTEETSRTTRASLRERIDRLLIHPITGIPILLLILYFGLYKFVGGFAAGTVVDYLEGTLFGEMINPWIIETFNSIVPYPVIQDLFVGEYGILTQAVTYAIALVMPLVGAFFIVFSIIEDTGYLPRLAMLIDRAFKKMGMSGRAVIPMVLGFGCATMATMVTRTLETKREKIITSMLLSLAIPCSAQLGVILGILSFSSKALLIWAFVIGIELLFIGFLSSKVLPGKSPSFFMEMPPLRLPKLSNVLIKTYSRMQWYFLEVLPLFVVASVLIWIGRLTGLFELAVRLFSYPSQWIGLPAEGGVMFLYGFFRRDFGAAGLFDMYNAGMLTEINLVVAAITLTLFMPCIAQFMVTVKERGLKIALGMAAFIFPSAFAVGYVVNYVLTTFGVVL